MEQLLDFAFSFYTGVSEVIAWFTTSIDLGSFGEWTPLSLIFGAGLVVVLGYKVVKFFLPTS